MNSAAEIKRAFTKARLIALAEAEGLATRAGRIQCPKRCSEDPRGASVSDSPDGALWHCARCSAAGSALDLVMVTRGLDLAGALEQLAGQPLPTPKLRVVKPPMNGAALWERLSPTDPAGETYLRGRGLEAALPHVRFNTGRTGDSWIDGLSSKGYRLAVPLRDVSGAVLDFQLRSVTPGITGREAKRSLCGERPKSTAFGRPDLARGGGRVYIAEGMADTLALLAAGVVVLGAPGCDQLRHLVKLVSARADVVLCPQNDDAEQSQKAFEEVAKQLRVRGCTVRQLTTPEAHKDPADWLKATGLEAFRQAIVSPPELAAPAPEPIVAPSPSGPFELSDTGNAERLVALHGKDLRYSKAFGWLVWDGKRWAHDDTDEVARRGKSAVRSIYAEAMAAQDSEVRKRLLKHATSSESAAKRRAMTELAASEPSIPVRPTELDADPWLFNCRNGTLDLRTGGLRSHAREDLQSKLAPVDYEPAATCPRWLQFLEDVQPDPEVRGFLQRFIGSSLTGVVREHLFVVNHGSGRNGKGVFTDTLLAVLGEYARQVPTELLMAKHGDVHPTERTELLGRRLAVASETEEGKALNVALVKALTGGDTISARRMHHDFFTFEPTHKLMLSTNHRPRIRETKDAIWARMKLVPWNAKFDDANPRTNLNLKLELREEYSGILRWAVEGCRTWQAHGLAAPEAVRAATAEYRTEEDPVGTFVDDCCVVGPDAACTVRDLRAAYERWCEEQGEQYPLGGRAFNERLEARSCKRVGRKIAGLQTKSWLGIGLAAENGREGQGSEGQQDRYP